MSRLGQSSARQDPLADPEALVRRIYAYVAYRIGDGPDAEDVTGETFARGLRYRDSYDSSKGSPIAWLIGIARRCMEDARRERTLERDPPEVAAPEDLEEESLTRLSLWQAVARLDERDRHLIALRYGADLSAKEIGRQLEMKTNAVEVALHRALGRLRPLLEEHPAAGAASRDAAVRISSFPRYEGVEAKPVEAKPERRRRTR
jgi:RNA polymerase sigma-70 factor (ECF subfamily)